MAESSCQNIATKHATGEKERESAKEWGERDILS